MVPEEVRRLWCTLAAAPYALQPGTTTVVHGSRGLARQGWTGVVRLGDAYLIEAGDADVTALDRLRDLEDPSDPAQVASALSPAETLGPGQLAYLPAGARVADVGREGDVREVSVASLRGWLDSVPKDAVDESSVAEMDQVLVLLEDGEVLGAAGHLTWPTEIGHVGVLVAPGARGGGAGTRLGAAATQRVLDLGMTPQWRAAGPNAASRSIARSIGYLEMGRQFSFRLAR